MKQVLGLAVFGALLSAMGSTAEAQVAVSVGNPYGYYGGGPGVYVNASPYAVTTYPVAPRYVAPVNYGYRYAPRPAFVNYGYAPRYARPFYGRPGNGPYRRYYY